MEDIDIEQQDQGRAAGRDYSETHVEVHVHLHLHVPASGAPVAGCETPARDDSGRRGCGA